MPSPTRRLAALCAAGLAAPALLVAAGSPAGALPGNPGNGAVANAHPPTTGRCAPATDRKVAGTLVAPGGLGVDATIGVDLLDRNGTKIDLVTGCPSNGAYGAVVQLNHFVGGSGQRVGSTQHDAAGAAQGAVDPHWALLNLPANVAHVYVETYNRAYQGSSCGLSCANPMDTSHFSQVNLRNLTPGPATANLKLTPVLASTTGSLRFVFNRSDIIQVAVFALSGSDTTDAWSLGAPAQGSRSGAASTWVAAALPTTSPTGYLVTVTTAAGHTFIVPNPATGAKTGYKTRRGTTTTLHVTLR